MATVEIRFSLQAPSYIADNPTKFLADGEPIFFNDGTYVFGDGVTQLQNLTVFGTGFSQSGTNLQYIAGDGSYVTFPTNVSSFSNDSGYITSSALSPYLTSANAALTYQPIGSYLTSAAIGVTVQGYSANTTLLGNSTTGSGTSIVLGTSPTFTTDIRTPLIYGSTSASGTLTLGSTSNATKGNILFGTSAYDEVNNRLGIGTTSPTQSLHVSGGNILVRGSSGTVLDVGNTFSVFNVVASSGVCSAYNLFVTNGSMTIQTTTPVLVLNNSNVQIRRVTNSMFVDTYDDLTVVNKLSTYNMLTLNGTKTTGASTGYSYIAPNNTGQTASTAINGVLWTLGSRQWNTGAITTQKEFELTSPTYSFVGASTITNAYSLYVNAPTAGINATITNNYAAGFGGNVNVIGSLYSTGFILVDGSQGLNKVLVSDANGNASWATSSTGYSKSINNISTNTSAGSTANTDYYYICNATLTLTLPTAVGNTNTYFIKLTAGTLTINTTSSQTIDGSTSITISVADTARTLISDGSNWQII